MPYTSLVSPSARAALGLSDLSRCVLVFDEAHNVADAAAQAHERVTTLPQVEEASLQLEAYLAKYRHRLSQRNVRSINSLLQLLGALASFLRTEPDPAPQSNNNSDNNSDNNNNNNNNSSRSNTSKSSGGVKGDGDSLSAAAAANSVVDGSGEVSAMLKPSEFSHASGLDGINVFSLQSYLRRSQLCNKVRTGLETRAELLTRRVGASSPLPFPSLPFHLPSIIYHLTSTNKLTMQ